MQQCMYRDMQREGGNASDEGSEYSNAEEFQAGIIALAKTPQQ